MPLKPFTKAMYKGLETGENEVAVGAAAEAALKGFEADRQKAFRDMIGMVDNLLKQYQK